MPPIDCYNSDNATVRACQVAMHTKPVTMPLINVMPNKMKQWALKLVMDGRCTP